MLVVSLPRQRLYEVQQACHPSFWNIHRISPIVWCACSIIELACGFFNQKNSEPWSRMTCVGHGYLVSQVCFNLIAIMSTLLVLIDVMSNQPVPMLIIVRGHNVFLWLLGCSNWCEQIRSMHSLSHGIVLALTVKEFSYLWYLFNFKFKGMVILLLE